MNSPVAGVDLGEGEKFRTKIEIMAEILRIAVNNFDIVGKVVDSWYASFRFLGNDFVTELKSNRKASFQCHEEMTAKNRDMFLSIDEIVESTFLLFQRNSDILKDFPLHRSFHV